MSLSIIELKLLALLIIANGAPIIIRNIFGKTWAFPLDANLVFVDGQPLFGKSKTLRGVLSAIVLTGLVAPLMGFSIGQGCLLAAMSMAGDLMSSFVKRRLKMDQSRMALGIDQVPESLLPLLVLKGPLALSWPGILRIVVLFFVLELVLSRILYWLGIRRNPY